MPYVCIKFSPSLYDNDSHTASRPETMQPASFHGVHPTISFFRYLKNPYHAIPNIITQWIHIFIKHPYNKSTSSSCHVPVPPFPHLRPTRRFTFDDCHGTMRPMSGGWCVRSDQRIFSPALSLAVDSQGKCRTENL